MSHNTLKVSIFLEEIKTASCKRFESIRANISFVISFKASMKYETGFNDAASASDTKESEF